MEGPNSSEWSLATLPVEIWKEVAPHLEFKDVCRLWLSGSRSLWSRFVQNDRLELVNASNHYAPLLACFPHLRYFYGHFSSWYSRGDRGPLVKLLKDQPKTLESLELQFGRQILFVQIDLPPELPSWLPRLTVLRAVDHVAVLEPSHVERIPPSVTDLAVSRWATDLPLPASLTAFEAAYLCRRCHEYPPRGSPLLCGPNLLRLSVTCGISNGQNDASLSFRALPPSLLTLDIRTREGHSWNLPSLPPNLTHLRSWNSSAPLSANFNFADNYHLTAIEASMHSSQFANLPRSLTWLKVRPPWLDKDILISDIVCLPVKIRHLFLLSNRRVRCFTRDPVLPFRHLETWDAPSIDLACVQAQMEAIRENRNLQFFGAPYFRVYSPTCTLEMLPSSLRQLKLYTGYGAVRLASVENLRGMPPHLTEWHLDTPSFYLPSDLPIPCCLDRLYVRVMECTGFTDIALMQLCLGDHQLRVFETNSRDLTDDAIFYLPQHLTSLTLSKAPVTPECFEHLPPLLLHLQLSGCQDDPQERLLKLPQSITSLILGGRNVTDSIATFLEQLKSLTFLCLSNNTTLRHSFWRELVPRSFWRRSGAKIKTKKWQCPSN